MDVFTHNMKVLTKIPARRIFDALCTGDEDLLTKFLFPKAMAIRNIELIKRDGGPGSIKKITFGEGRHVKYIDEKSFSVNYSLIERGAPMNNLGKISLAIKFISAPDGGSICNVSSSKHYTSGDIYIKEEDVKAEKETALGFIKAVEAYLLADRKVSKMKVD